MEYVKRNQTEATKNAQKWSGGNTKTPDHLRKRLQCFTKFGSEPVYKESCMVYLAYGKETCPKTKRLHWQGFVYWKNPQTIAGASKKLGNAHVENCEGTLEDNERYCSKEGEYKTFGKKPQQGERIDLKALIDKIGRGETNTEKIAIEQPMAYHQYGRTLEKAEDIYMRKQFRTEMTKGIWVTGKSGSGKSHYTLDDYSPDTHYIYRQDNGWWEGYKQQDIVVINDFKGEIKYGELLQLIDKWPYFVKRRCREPVPFTSKKVIITSIMRPEEVYHNLHAKDGIDQLLRRIEIVELQKDP